MRRRDVEVPGFLVRPPDWWQQRRPHANPGAFQVLAFAGAVLAGMGELRSDELARLQAIATGQEIHPHVRRDAARAILAHR